MRYFLFLSGLFCTLTYGDTVDHYMNIVNNLPQMEMKADPQAQAWARSARNILTLTGECIAETLVLANNAAKQGGKPLFCLPIESELNSVLVNNLVQETYRNISSQESDKDKMTVSEVALLGLEKRYPCNQPKNQYKNQMLSNWLKH